MICIVWFSGIGSYYAAQAGLELTTQSGLAWTIQQSSCHSLSSIGSRGMHHHTRLNLHVSD